MGQGLAGTLRRTNADKRRAVEIALKEFPKLSSREIAKVCAVSDEFVNKVRPEELRTVSSSQTRIGADGKERKGWKRRAPHRAVLCGICVALSPSEERWCPEWAPNDPRSLVGKWAKKGARMRLCVWQCVAGFGA